MARYTMDAARKNFTDLVNRAAYGKERIVIGRRNKDLAVLVPIEDVEFLERLEDEIDVREADRALREKDRALDFEEAEQRLDRGKKRKSRK